MYSSGTTGKPKCIVHSIGGTLLQHIKELGLHADLTAEKSILYFTTCGWMMWNWLVSSLAIGARLCLYEGSPGFPSIAEFYETIEREQINIFGTSPKFLKALEDSGYECQLPMPHFETMLSTGAPLLPEQYDFIYQKLKQDICVSSIAGGTDIIGCFMLGNPNLPVYAGEIQCLGLGMDVAAFDDDGQALIDHEGELVCRHSFPSRPIYFLNDETNARINDAYFNHYENIWTHGDFVKITNRGSVIVYGRSDATLNPGGVRIGTAEIYRQTEGLSWIEDSLCVGRPADGDVEVVLFVKLVAGESLTQQRILEIKQRIKTKTTPRHVPTNIWSVTDIPYTRSGKKMELAISRILADRPIKNFEAVANPDCLKQYKAYQS
jgi:acetoacetyl-CoA synthetase